MNKLKEYAGLLNEDAPKDHFLAYITNDEKDMLVKSGGTETPTASGIFAYPGGAGRSDYQAMESAAVSHQPPGGQHDASFQAHHGGGGGQLISTPSKADLGMVDAESEYLEPDRDHWKATQKAIKEHQKGDYYQADWTDWSKEQQDTYQLEMNKLKGTTDKNYSFYKGNEGTTNLSFGEHWKDVVITDPALKFSPILRLLVSAGRTLKENLTTDYGTYKYGAREGTGSGRAVDQGGWMGRIFNSDGSVNTDLTDSEINDIYNDAMPDLPYVIGNEPPKEKSMVDEYFANLNNTNLGINQNYLNTYNTAKTNIANTLNMTSNTQQYGYGNTFNDNYARSMTSANPFFEELTDQGLI